MSDKTTISVRLIRDKALKYFQEINPANIKDGVVKGQSYEGFLAYCYTLALSDMLIQQEVIEKPFEIKW